MSWTSPRGSIVEEDGPVPTVMSTSDAGATWVGVPETETWEHSSLTAVDIHFLDAQRGFILTLRYLLSTIDGGQTWNTTDLPGGVRVWSACAHQEGQIWLGGERIHGLSADMSSWHDATLPAFLTGKLDISDIAFSDALTGWAVGGDGLVLRYYGENPSGMYVADPAGIQLWDVNRDGVLDAGERMFAVFVPPQGQPRARLEAIGTLSSADASFRGLRTSGAVEFPVVSEPLSFTYAETAFGRGRMEVQLALVDQGQTRRRTFDVEVCSPRQPVLGLVVIDSAGNGDGQLQPGERVGLRVVLGDADVDVLEASQYSLVPGNDCVQHLSGNRIDFEVDGGQLVSSAASLGQYLVSGDVRLGDHLPFVLRAQGPFATATDTLHLEVGPGLDVVAPALTGPLQHWFGEQGLTLFVSGGHIIEGSAIARVTVQLDGGDEQGEIELELMPRGEDFVTVWRAAEPRPYRATLAVKDAAGNLTRSESVPVGPSPRFSDSELVPIVGGGRQRRTCLGPYSDFSDARALEIGPQGELYIAHPRAIHRWTRDGVAEHVAGTRGWGYAEDGTLAIEADLHPGGLAIDSQGRLCFSDERWDRVRRIEPDGSIITIAGSVQGFGGDGGPAVDAMLDGPRGVAFDREGNLYICDTSNSRVRRVDTNGIITTVAGTGPAASTDATQRALEADVGWPADIAVTASGVMYISTYFDRVLRLEAGMIEPFVGTGSNEGTAEGPALEVALDQPDGLALDGSGNLYVTSRLGRLYQVSPDGQAALLVDGDGLRQPDVVAVDDRGSIFIGDSRAHRVFMLDGVATPVPQITAVDVVSEGVVPSHAQLHPVFPNPFNGTATIRFSASSPANVSLRIYNMAGQRVRTLVDGHLQAGEHFVHWDGRDDEGWLAGTGIYITRLRAGTVMHVQRMALLR